MVSTSQIRASTLLYSGPIGDGFEALRIAGQSGTGRELELVGAGKGRPGRTACAPPIFSSPPPLYSLSVAEGQFVEELTLLRGDSVVSAA